MPVPSTEHCSPAAQPHCGTVSLHGSFAHAGPEPVDVVVLLVEVVSLPVDVALVPVVVVLLPVVGLPPAEVLLPVVVLVPGAPPLPGPLESPPTPPVVDALAQAETSKSKLPKKRSDRGRIGHLANWKKARGGAYARRPKGQRSGRSFVKTMRSRPGPA